MTEQRRRGGERERERDRPQEKEGERERERAGRQRWRKSGEIRGMDEVKKRPEGENRVRKR